MNACYLAILTSLALVATNFAEPTAELFTHLNADSYADRHKAQIELATWADENPDQALEQFFDAYAAAKSPELKTRLGQLLRERVLFDKFGRPKGFVGIRMDNGVEKVDGEIHAVVVVTSVVKGSPAEVFGLKHGDALWRVDQQTFNNNAFASLQFIQIVTTKREGDTIVIDLLRDAKPIEIKLVLGALPAELEQQHNRRLNKDPQLDKENYFNDWLQKKLDGANAHLKAAVE